MDSEEEDVQIISRFLGITEGSKDDKEYISDEAPKVVLGLQAPKMTIPKVITEEQKRISSAVSWPSSLPEVFEQTVKMAKAKSFLTTQPFQNQKLLRSIKHLLSGPLMIF